jgi:hypothetical protein
MNIKIDNPQKRISQILNVSRTFWLLAATICLLLPGGLAVAQQSTGTIVGNVSDTTGAVVVGAKVHITNTETNTVRDAVSDSAGQYAVPALSPGNYSVTVEMEGFQGQRTPPMVLQASQTARVDFKVVPGKVSESITVNDASVQLQTENAVVGTVVDAKKIEDLPLNGRNFVQLTQLIPGVNPGTSGSITVRRGRGSIGQTDSSFGSTAAQVNGQRDTQNRYFIDGSESMDYDAYTYSFSPSVDAISQFKVDTSTSGADSGGAAGATVNMIVKSGTNQLHGTLWEFNRNNDFTQAYDAIKKVSVTPARLNRNQFGGNIGGPVVFPHLYNGRDKTFFFFNWEIGYSLNGATVSNAIVPPAAMRNGDFSQLVDKTGKPIVIADPTTGQPFANNQIPTTRLSPQALAFLKFVPTPNFGPSLQNNVNNYATTPINTLSTQHDYITRIDHNLGQHDVISGHYIFNATYQAGGAFWGHDQDNNLANSNNIAFSETHIFTPALVNDFRYGWNLFAEFETYGSTGNKAYDVAGAMGIPFASTDPEYYGPPVMNISGADGAYRVYALQGNQIGPRNRSNGINQASDTISWQRGKHFIKFSAELDRRTVTFGQERDPRGHFTFNGQYTGSALADFMLGYIQSDSINPTHTHTDLSSWTQAYYVQDNWSVTPRLTLNLGVRFEHYSPWVQNNDQYADIYIASNGVNPGSVMTPSTSPYGRGLIQATYKDVGPRVGFAYQPFGQSKAVVRGGYGIYYTPEITNAFFTMAEGAQAQSGAQLIGNPAGQQPNLLFSNPFPGVTTGGPSTYPFATAIDQHLQDQYTQEWNITVQTQLPAKFVLDTAYVGAKGTHNFVSYNDINLPTPSATPAKLLPSLNSRRPNQTWQRSVQGDFSTGSSIYHAFQGKLERRLSQGLTVLASYTWSKSISGPGDIGGIVGGGAFGAGGINPYDPRSDRSVSIFDIPHRFVGTVLYDVPFFSRTHGMTKKILDGFQLSTILTAQSGVAGNVTNTVDTTATGINSRPDQVPGAQVSLAGSSSRSYSHWFNTAAFTTAQLGEFGTSPRTAAVRLPGLVNDDFSVTKGIKFGEYRNLQFRADIFNLFNHYNPDPQTVGLALNSAQFGQVGTSNSTTTRIIQLAGKLYF